MPKSKFICLTAAAIALLVLLSVVSAEGYTGSEQEAQPERTQEEIELVREAQEKSMVERALSLVGKNYKPHQVLNFALNPAKDLDRFTADQHTKARDNEQGMFVVEKGSSEEHHVGVWNTEAGTIVHARRAADGKTWTVVEEKIADARSAFPHGWRRTGPDGRLKREVMYTKKIN